MQSSGVGNCVNMFSLLSNCQFPFLTLVTMRGEYAEFNPWQGAMGRSCEQYLHFTFTSSPGFASGARHGTPPATGTGGLREPADRDPPDR